MLWFWVIGAILSVAAVTILLWPQPVDDEDDVARMLEALRRLNDD